MSIEITREIMETIVRAQIYRDDVIIALRKLLAKDRLTEDKLNEVYNEAIRHPQFQAIKADTLKLEELTLVDDTVDTIALYYNKLLKEAKFEKKYEVVIRILKEIQQLRAIENNETKFEISIKVDIPGLFSLDKSKTQEVDGH